MAAASGSEVAVAAAATADDHLVVADEHVAASSLVRVDGGADPLPVRGRHGSTRR
jgi:hypothetical protein